MNKQIEWEFFIDPRDKGSVDIDLKKEDDEEDGQLMEMKVVHVGPDGQDVSGTDGPLITDIYNIWIGHTNWRLTEADLSVVCMVDGTESLRQLTQYRFMIAFGKLFDSVSVKKNIQKLLYEDEQEQIDLGIDKIREMLSDTEIPKEFQAKINKEKKRLSKFDEWAIFVFPNGSMESCHNLEDNFEEKLYDYIILQNAIKGILVTSNE